MLRMDGQAICYSEQPFPPVLRMFILGLGAGLAVVMPLTFLVLADWTALSAAHVAAALFILVSTVAGAFFLRVGLAGAVDLRLDPASGHAIRTRRGLFLRRSDRVALSALAPPEIFMRDSVEDQPFPVLRLRFPTGRSIDISDFRDPAEARLWQGRIAALIAGGAGVV